jgi:hypothetical protein
MIRHRAWLAWRSPPGLSRRQTVLPEEAGMGATAHRCAQAASLRSRSGWSPAAMTSSAAVWVPQAPGPLGWRTLGLVVLRCYLLAAITVLSVRAIQLALGSG